MNGPPTRLAFRLLAIAFVIAAGTTVLLLALRWIMARQEAAAILGLGVGLPATALFLWLLASGLWRGRTPHGFGHYSRQRFRFAYWFSIATFLATSALLLVLMARLAARVWGPS